ncbi:hypothetical protein AN695_0220155 [Serratia marcescens]|uniref:Uncharacterized protein n=1 Tax=Serratia marcescens TaxID=615 RepID=A0A6H3A1P7_SERMA|nr:hypothetical protein AN695_0220155 [Serratia marcescens]
MNFYRSAQQQTPMFYPTLIIRRCQRAQRAFLVALPNQTNSILCGAKVPLWRPCWGSLSLTKPGGMFLMMEIWQLCKQTCKKH